MTTWATLRQNIRLQLDDTGDTPKWTDAELLLYVKRAVQAYSQYFPMDATATPTGSDGDYTVEDTWDIDRVSHTTDADYEEFLEELDRLPGQAMHYYLEGWWREDTTLSVYPTTLEDVKIYYTSCHTLPTQDSSVLTVPIDDEGLLEVFVLRKCHDRYVGKTGLLDRWKESGKRDDNPILMSVINWQRQWEHGIAQRLSRRRLRMYKKGRDASYAEARSAVWLTS